MPLLSLEHETNLERRLRDLWKAGRKQAEVIAGVKRTKNRFLLGVPTMVWDVPLSHTWESCFVKYLDIFLELQTLTFLDLLLLELILLTAWSANY